MKQQRPTEAYGPGFTLLLTINLLLCLIAAEILDYVASTGDRTLILLSIALLLALLASLAWSFWRVRKVGIVSPSAGLSWHVPRKIVWPALLIFTALAAGLRFYQLGAESFWYDEVWTIFAADRPLNEILAASNPWTYIPVSFLLQLGRSEFFLRFSSALPGVLTVPVVYHLGREMYGRQEGVITALLFGISFYTIYYSQELRFYAWQILFSTLSLYFLLSGLRHNRFRHWLGFALSTALNLYNHPGALFLLASEGLYVAFFLTRDFVQSRQLRLLFRRMAWPALAALAALASYLTQVPALIQFYNPRWIVSMQASVRPLYFYEKTWAVNPITYGIHGMFGSFSGSKSYPILLFFLLGLFLLGLLSSRRQVIFLTLIVILLPLPIVLLAHIRIYARYFGYFVPLILIVIVKGIIYLTVILSKRPRRQAILCSLLLMTVAVPNLLSLSVSYAEPTKDQWREVAALVDTRHEPGDLLLIHPLYPLTVSPFDWYSTASEEELPRKFFPEDGVLSDLNQLDDLASVTRGYRRVWLLFANQSPESEAVLLDTAKQTYRQIDEWSFIGLHLLLFEVQ